MIQLRHRQGLIAEPQLNRRGISAGEQLIERLLPQFHLAREILRHQTLRRVVMESSMPDEARTNPDRAGSTAGDAAAWSPSQ